MLISKFFKLNSKSISLYMLQVIRMQKLYGTMPEKYRATVISACSLPDLTTSSSTALALYGSSRHAASNSEQACTISCACDVIRKQHHILSAYRDVCHGSQARTMQSFSRFPTFAQKNYIRTYQAMLKMPHASFVRTIHTCTCNNLHGRM